MTQPSDPPSAARPALPARSPWGRTLLGAALGLLLAALLIALLFWAALCIDAVQQGRLGVPSPVDPAVMAVGLLALAFGAGPVALFGVPALRRGRTGRAGMAALAALLGLLGSAPLWLGLGRAQAGRALLLALLIALAAAAGGALAATVARRR